MFISRIKSIKNKVIASIVLVCLLTMTTGFAIVLLKDISRIKQTAADQAAMIAKMIGESCVSAISFNYPDRAEKNLSLVGSLPGFENARIYKENGDLFASYDRSEKIVGPPAKDLKPARYFLDGNLHLVESITYEGKDYGLIYLRVRPAIESAVRSRTAIMAGLLLGLLFLSYLLASLVQRLISAPILELAGTAEKISEEMDYSVRLENTHRGEIGVLFHAFNSMLTAIQHREVQRSRAEGNLQFKEQVIESTTSCIATADLKGRVTYANPSFLKLFGLRDPEEIRGTSFLRFFMVREVFDLMLGSPGNREAWTMETKARRRDGSCFDAIFAADTIRNAGDNPGSLVITVSDISELRRTTREMEQENWLKSGQSAIYDRLRGEQEVRHLAENVLRGLKEHIDFQVAAVYVANGRECLTLAASYALQQPRGIREEFPFGEGLAGQAAVERKRILVSDLPEDYVWISSGVGKAPPRFLLAMPFIYEQRVKGVLELGSFTEFQEKELELLERMKATIAIAVHTAQAREQVQELLEKTQSQSEELQAQTEELRSQQEELQQTNEELEEQRDDINKKNQELEKARQLVEKKAADLETAGRYKSEFLANMSHELRTPLNSIMLLSNVLLENRQGSLSDKNLEYARNIHDSGADLLSLINDILDLSKVESGKMELVVENIPLVDLTNGFEKIFAPVSQDKGLPLTTEIEEDLPARIRTDRQKIEQILKNLLSNAFKFTERGAVSLRIQRPDDRLRMKFPSYAPETTLVFSVTDTGIGIPEEKQSLIFDAFMQVDGTTSRKYGGTGLGLSISREIAGLLGGELTVESRPGQGATFSLLLPQVLPGSLEDDDPPGDRTVLADEADPLLLPVAGSPEQDGDIPVVQDDRARLAAGDKLILIIENDRQLHPILQNLAHEEGFKTVIADNGTTGLHFADYYRPAAVILDIGLPDTDGWQVMTRLKDNLATRHIPVHVISAAERRHQAMKMGAAGFLTRPVTTEKLERIFDKLGAFIAKPVRNLLIVEDDQAQFKAIKELLGNGDIRISGVTTGQEAMERLRSNEYDCMILDLNLPDMSGEKLLAAIRNDNSFRTIPVIIYTGKDLTQQEKTTLQSYAESIIIKGEDSFERLLDETALFLHRVETALSQSKREILRRIHDQGSTLKGKHILLVDDDMRNVFAITSILEDQGLTFTICKNGREAIAVLADSPSINLVLMDMMMPEMDGYQAMCEIRKQRRFEKLPIIAITAKAMVGDRFKCIEAGASDYLAKPVDRDKLLSMMRVWLY